jgi:glyoxylase-like metal-dependent hydrolase (beta-lactamase superfamily II)
MKAHPDRHPANAEGDWYIDRRCIDCGASPSVAPGLIVRREGQSVFDHQPATEAETEAAWRAMLVCPTASVRRMSGGSPPAGLYPEELAPGVYRCGYNAASSYGAHSYFVARPGGNVMIDAPRWTRHVADFVRGHGGLRHIFLTHRDDVADAHKYAHSFDADVWIHERDADAAPYATRVLSGTSAAEPSPGWQAIPLPGHTAGSSAFLLENTYLFTGDSLAWSHDGRRLVAFRDACWYSWSEQARSLERLLAFDFEWVLAGHGGSIHLPWAQMRAELQALLRWMATAR